MPRWVGTRTPGRRPERAGPSRGGAGPRRGGGVRERRAAGGSERRRSEVEPALAVGRVGDGTAEGDRVGPDLGGELGGREAGAPLEDEGGGAGGEGGRLAGP